MFVRERPELDLQYCPRHVLHNLGEKGRERPGLLSGNKLDSNQAGVLCEGVSGEAGLFITQTSVAVMTSPSPLSHHTRLDSRLATSRSSMKYEETEEVCPSSCPSSCPGMCQKSHTERVVVALLLGALIIIFLTLVLSLVYLRESRQQQQYSQTMIYADREERLVQWGAANNVKIKPGSGLSSPASHLQGTCQLPQCWRLGRKVMLMADQTADPCHSFYNVACGGWLANISHHSRPGGRERSGEARKKSTCSLFSSTVKFFCQNLAI